LIWLSRCIMMRVRENEGRFLLARAPRACLAQAR